MNKIGQKTIDHRRLVARVLPFFATLVLTVGLVLGSTGLQAQGEPAELPQAVNINTADAQALAETLKGVGVSRAQEIVRYRETYGPFSSVDELIEVKGIGASTLEMNREVITLE